jgi:PhnB protein
MTQASNAPEGYRSVQPYLMFIHCEEAISFFEKVFDAKRKMCMKTPEGRIAHAEIEIGDSVIMMAEENAEMEAFGPAHYGGSPVSLMIYVENCDATFGRAIEAGATCVRQPADQPYGDRMGGIRDPFGYKWWIGQPLRSTGGSAQ